MVHNIMGEPQICIMNYANHTMTVFDIHNLSVAVNFSRSARAAIPIQATRDTFYDILYLDTNGLHILIDKSLPTLDIHSPIQDVDDLIDPIHESFTIVRRSDKRMFRFEGHFRPKTPLIRDCLAAINCATDIQFAQFWFRFIKSLYFNTRQNTTTTPLFYHEWNMFMISLLSCFELRRPDSPKKKETNYEKAFLSNKGLLQYQFSLSDLVPSAFDPLFIGREWEGIHAGIINAALNNENLLEIPLSSIVKSLHVLYEEYRIQKTMQIQFKQLGYLLLQCSAILKNQKWINYYESHGFKSRFVHKRNVYKIFLKLYTLLFIICSSQIELSRFKRSRNRTTQYPNVPKIIGTRHVF
jgi:hypothetical protein